MPDDGITIRVRGVAETQRALYSFSQQLGDRVVRSAMREGAKVVQREARRRAPKKTGGLRRGIVVNNSRVNTRRRNNRVGVYIKFRRGRSRDKPLAAFGHILELGWNTKGRRAGRGQRQEIVSRFGRRSGRKTLPGRTNVRGLKFLNQAFRNKRFAAVRVIEQATMEGARIVARRTGFRYRG